MRLFYVEHIDWTVSGATIWPVLCKHAETNALAFKQDFEARTVWQALEHETPRQALDSARMFINQTTKDKHLVLSEDETEILLVEPNQVFTMYRITSEEF
jgi:hypothetical protein